MTSATDFYELGNPLRGYFSGRFSTPEKAWDVLAERFNRAYPSRGGREVELRTVVKVGRTAGGNETEADRKLREDCERLLAQDRAAIPSHKGAGEP